VRTRLFNRSKKIVRTSSALLVRGILEKADGAINLRADRFAVLKVPIRSASRDWQ
jgi:error-prone DNA polymerase